MMMINEGGDSVKTISLLQNLPSSRRSLHKMTGFELFYPKNPPKFFKFSFAKTAEPFGNGLFQIIAHQRQSFMFTAAAIFPQLPLVGNFAIDTFQ